MAKTNEDFIGEQCIRTADDILSAKDEDRKIYWQSFHGKVLNT